MRAKPSQLTAPVILYGALEHALATVHGIAPEGVPALRGRFCALRRGGMLGAQGQLGKGAALRYTTDTMHRILLAFQLAELGLPSHLLLRLIESHWHKLRHIFSEAESALVDETPDVILLFSGGAVLSDKDPMIDRVTIDKLAPRLTSALDGERLPAHALVVNVTERLRRFHTALADVHPLEAKMKAMPERAQRAAKRVKAEAPSSARRERETA